MILHRKEVSSYHNWRDRTMLCKWNLIIKNDRWKRKKEWIHSIASIAAKKKAEKRQGGTLPKKYKSDCVIDRNLKIAVHSYIRFLSLISHNVTYFSLLVILVEAFKHGILQDFDFVLSKKKNVSCFLFFFLFIKCNNKNFVNHTICVDCELPL